LEWICKEALVAYLEVLTWYLPGETNENLRISQSRYRDGVLAENETRHLQNTNRKCCH